MSMPTGIILDCIAVLAGCYIGVTFKDKIPERVSSSLTIVFGMCAVLIGIVSFIKIHSLPAVILSLILGALLGEWFNIESKIRNMFRFFIDKLNFKITGNPQKYMHFYVTVSTVLCFSGTNIFGAMNESITGDITILLSKAIMDVFAGAIFAIHLGYAMSLIVIPQFIILTIFFYSANLIMPFINHEMLMDFTAVGGVITFIIGLSIAEIRDLSAINLLPALMLILPISLLFQKILL